MQKIIVDTNFLLMPFEYGIDIIGELRRIVHEPITLIISTGTDAELRTLAGRTGKRASAARAVLRTMDVLGQKFTIKSVKSSGEVDRWIIKFVQENSVCVATNDIPLRKRLVASGVPVISMKGKSKLDFV